MGELLRFPKADTSSLQQAMRNLLAADGSIEQRVVDSPVAPSVWRAIARAAARELGRPVQTLEFSGLLHASLRDWPATPEEEKIHEAALRRAMNGVKLDATNSEISPQ